MKKLFTTVILILTFTVCLAKTVRFSVAVSDTSLVEMIISVELEKIGFSGGEDLLLYHINDKKKVLLPSQVENNRLWWILDAPVIPGIRLYELIAGKVEKQLPVLQFSEQNGKLTIHSAGQELLTYQAAVMYPPSGVDTAFKRSGFIHPLRTPHGQVLTQVQPKDHYHHYGIWNPWTRVLFEDDTVDFWNLGDKQGTVRFSRITRKFEGQVFAGYEVLQEHVVFTRQGTERIALEELQEVRVYRPSADRYLVDMTIRYKCATSSPVRILAYRYAGLGWRATPEWNDANSSILTSEGKTRNNADGSLARWFIYQGLLGNESGGMAMFSAPSNYNHPEPLRIWPPGTNSRGDVFANFAPTKTKDWLLEPGKSYTLKYRFLVFNDAISSLMAEDVWKAFAEREYIVDVK